MTDHTLTVSKVIKASPETVWRCMTDAELIPRWFAPEPVRVTRALVEARPGGAFHIVMEVPGMGEMDGGAGCILVADPGERLVWTSALSPGFVPNDPPAPGQFAFTAQMTLTATESGCTYTAEVFHANAADAKQHSNMGFQTGWGTAATQLGKLAESL